MYLYNSILINREQLFQELSNASAKAISQKYNLSYKQFLKDIKQKQLSICIPEKNDEYVVLFCDDSKMKDCENNDVLEKYILEVQKMSNKKKDALIEAMADILNSASDVDSYIIQLTLAIPEFFEHSFKENVFAKIKKKKFHVPVVEVIASKRDIDLSKVKKEYVKLYSNALGYTDISKCSRYVVEGLKRFWEEVGLYEYILKENYYVNYTESLMTFSYKNIEYPQSVWADSDGTIFESKSESEKTVVINAIEKIQSNQAVDEIRKIIAVCIEHAFLHEFEENNCNEIDGLYYQICNHKLYGLIFPNANIKKLFELSSIAYFRSVGYRTREEYLSEHLAEESQSKVKKNIEELKILILEDDNILNTARADFVSNQHRLVISEDEDNDELSEELSVVAEKVAEGFEIRLYDTYRFLCKCGIEENTIEEKYQTSILSLLNEFNDYFYDVIGDSVVDFSLKIPCLYEDYVEEIDEEVKKWKI